MTRAGEEAAFLGALRPATSRMVPWLTCLLGEPAFRFMGMRRATEEVRLATARSILVVRPDEIGDVVLTGPFLRELRRNAPDAWITLVVKEAVANLVERCPHVNEVLTYDWLAPGLPNTPRLHLRALRLARKRLWPRGFDLAIVPRWDVDWYHGAFVAYLSGARQRVGYSVDTVPYKHRLNPGYDRLFTRVLTDTAVRHEVERGLALLGMLGGTIRDTRLELWTGPEDREFSEGVLQDHGTERSRPLIALAPGARAANRLWPIERFADLGAQLTQEYAARLLVLGGPGEEALGQELQSRIGSAVINMVGRTTLRQAGVLLQRCALYVGNDSGVMHLAAAARVPVVELSAHPASGYPLHPSSPKRFGPWGVPHAVLQPERPRPPCAGACQATDAHCICDITVEEAHAAAARLLRGSAAWAPHPPPAPGSEAGSGRATSRSAASGAGSPPVSIVTPSFNQGAFLEATILSVLTQEYPNLEYLVLDGGSTDGSVDVIRRHAARLAYWVSQPDAGQADAINRGFARARGDILAWLNSDDTYEPGAVGAAVEAFRAHPEADALYGDCAYVDEAGSPLTVFCGEPFDLAGYLTTEGYIHQPTVFLRRRVLERIGVLDPAFHLCLDYEFWLRVATACHWLYLPQTLARFRVHARGKSCARSPEFLAERLRCLDRLFADRRISTEVVRRRRQAYAVAYLSGGERAYESGDSREARVRLLAALRWDPNPLRPRTWKALLLLGDLLTGSRAGKRLVDRRRRKQGTRRRSRVPGGAP